MRTEEIKYKLLAGGSEAVEAASDLVIKSLIVVGKTLNINEVKTWNLDLSLDYDVKKLMYEVFEQIEKPIYYTVIWYADINNYEIVYSCNVKEIEEYIRIQNIYRDNNFIVDSGYPVENEDFVSAEENEAFIEETRVKNPREYLEFLNNRIELEIKKVDD